MTTKKVLLTGSSGLLGYAANEFLRQKGIQTVCFDIRENPKYDVRDFSFVQNCVKDVKGIVHMAAVSRPREVLEKPLEAVDINIKGTIHLLEAAKQAKNKPWLIFVSSREVFGDAPKHPVTEKSPRVAKDLYVIYKIACEEVCRLYSQCYGLQTRVLRFSNLYTSRFDHLDRVIPQFIRHAAEGKDIKINGEGTEYFDFVHVGDAARVIYLCILDIQKRKVFFDDFNIGSGESLTLPKVAHIVIQSLESRSKIGQGKRDASISNFRGDYSKARRILRFIPRISFRDGINLAIKEFKEAHII